MSVKGFKFNDTVNKYDYNELDNKPTPDATLTKTGQAADAKAVGDQLSTLKDDLKAGTKATAVYHLGLYIDEDGDICQVDDDEEA